MKINAELKRRYQWMRNQGAAGWVGHSAEGCLQLARADMALAHSDIEVMIEDEQEAWDGDCPAPDFLVWMRLVRPCPDHGVHCKHADTIGSLGMIGVNSMGDPYLRICAAELALEAGMGEVTA